MHASDSVLHMPQYGFPLVDEIVSQARSVTAALRALTLAAWRASSRCPKVAELLL